MWYLIYCEDLPGTAQLRAQARPAHLARLKDLIAQDRLILAGDLIERVPKNYEMPQWIEEKPQNVITILGNHEYEFAQNIQLMDELCNQLGEDPGRLKSSVKVYRLWNVIF